MMDRKMPKRAIYLVSDNHGVSNPPVLPEVDIRSMS
jgi:hypothetical protein